MKRVFMSILMSIVLSSFSVAYSQANDIDKAFKNFLILAQYGYERFGGMTPNNDRLVLDIPWHHDDDDYYQRNLWTGGFITHIDLSPNDIDSALVVYSKYYKNIYGEYRIPESNQDEYVKQFTTTNINGEIGFVTDDGYHNLGIYFNTETPLKYLGDHTNLNPELGRYVTITRPDENKITKYYPTGEPFASAPVKLLNGYIVEFDNDGEIIRFNYSDDKLTEVRLKKSDSPEKQLISFTWEENSLKSFSYTLEDDSCVKFYTKVLSVNKKGLWTQLQLYQLVDGEEIPYILYERVFDGEEPSMAGDAVSIDKKETIKDDKIDLNNYLLISQYANYIEKPWTFTDDDDLFIFRYCRDGFYTHCDLSISDMGAVMPVTATPFIDKFGDYVLDDSSMEKFITVCMDGGLGVPYDEDRYNSILLLDEREKIAKSDDRVVIQHRDKNKLAYYNSEGIIIEEIECRFDESGKILFISRSRVGTEKDGYHITYDQLNNISHITLKEYRQVGSEKYEISKQTDVAFQWNNEVPIGMTISSTNYQPLVMKMKVLETNANGKWNKMQLMQIKDGKEIPVCQYCRNFYKTKDDYQNSQNR